MKNEIKRFSGFELLPFILALASIIICTLGTLSYYNSSEILKENIISSMKWRTEDNAVLISRNIAAFKTIIEGIACTESIKSMEWSIQEPVLLGEKKRLKVNDFQVFDLNGKSYSINGDNLDIFDSRWVKTALHGSTSISQPLQDKTENQTIFICATPIKNNQDKIEGVLIVSVNPEFLFNIVKNIKVGKKGYGYIFDKEGNMIAHPDFNDIFNVKSSNKNKRYPNSIIKEVLNEKHYFYRYEYEDEEKCATYAIIPDTDWILALTSTTDEVFNEADNLRYKFLLLIFITIIISIILCLFIEAFIKKKRTINNLQKRVEENVRLLNECAELEKIRTQFFANVSHEFRTPLNVILSSIQLCKLYYDKQKTAHSNSIDKHLRVMKQNCYRLLRLVNNLIDTTRIDVGFVEKHMKNNNIVKIIEDITMSVLEFTENKGIKIFFNTNINEKIIACDEDKIERIMLNLISNAIKFTDPGGTITVLLFDKGNSIVLTVKDTGIGIPESKKKVIFERFVQVEETLTRNHEGSGIGLSMVKAFVEMHDGTIELNSEFGKGSEFIIKLPVTVLDNEDKEISSNDITGQQRIERIKIEFSDIYYCN
jgi:signal transduction histidine kinase